MTPFTVAIPDDAVADLQDRLARTRWPRSLPVGDWTVGTPIAYVRALAERWRDGYDWRTWEARLNAVPQFVTDIAGQPIHFLHARSPEPDALPLLMTHGWPGSVAEFLDVLGPLTDPAAHGGSGSDAFHVVAPSVPGHGFSVPLTSPGWDHARIARAWVALMGRLGYGRYGTQGGDTGSVVSPEVARLTPDAVVGVHIHGMLAVPEVPVDELASLGPADQRRLAVAREWSATAGGYAQLQSTKPQTVSFALSDSPVGQLAWIAEKFHDWNKTEVPVDHLLTAASLYWFTNTSATSANLYRENRLAAAGPRPRSGVPTAVAVFPTDVAIRPLLEREHAIARWTEFERGGHFAALAAGDALIDDLRAFFRTLR